MLTPKQEKFCLVYLETGNASEAWRQAYGTGKASPATVNRRAKEMLDNGKIQARLEELRKPAVEAAQVTLEQHLNDLKDLRDKATKARKWSAAISAEVARGKAAGLYVEKHEVGVSGYVQTVSEEENLDAWAQKHGS